MDFISYCHAVHFVAALQVTGDAVAVTIALNQHDARLGPARAGGVHYAAAIGFYVLRTADGTRRKKEYPGPQAGGGGIPRLFLFCFLFVCFLLSFFFVFFPLFYFCLLFAFFAKNTKFRFHTKKCWKYYCIYSIFLFFCF